MDAPCLVCGEFTHFLKPDHRAEFLYIFEGNDLLIITALSDNSIWKLERVASKIQQAP